MQLEVQIKYLWLRISLTQRRAVLVDEGQFGTSVIQRQREIRTTGSPPEWGGYGRAADKIATDHWLLTGFRNGAQAIHGMTSALALSAYPTIGNFNHVPRHRVVFLLASRSGSPKYFPNNSFGSRQKTLHDLS